MRVVAVAAWLACWTVALEAHDAAHVAPGPSGWDLLAVGVLLVSGVLYAAGAQRLRRRHAPSSSLAAQASYWTGWLVMLAAILPPLDGLVTRRFAAHMLQHELLMLVGVPLMIAGRPLATWLWGLPDGLRRSVVPLLQGGATSAVARLLTAPVTAWALHGVVIWVWHVPALYQAAVLNEGVHALQHAMFCVTSALFWWGLVYGRYGRAGYGASVFFVFTTLIHTGLLGAVFTLAPEPLYPLYAARAPDPLADQQLAGLVMWIPAGLVLTLVGVGLFAAWIGEADRRAVKRMV
jgi:putative membrane protein